MWKLALAIFLLGTGWFLFGQNTNAQLDYCERIFLMQQQDMLYCENGQVACVVNKDGGGVSCKFKNL